MPVGLNTIGCLRILFPGPGLAAICINGWTDTANDYVKLLIKHSSSMNAIWYQTNASES
jgi:hypothetical protein